MKKHKDVIFHNLYFIKAYQDLVREKKIAPNQHFLDLIQKRSVRTMSGVTPVTVLMKPFPCPGKCIYCPTDVRMPKSYLPSQPAAQRGFRQQFDPYTQVFARLKALQMTGHEISKVELRILGGTFSAYPKNYQTWFVKRCILAMNEFKKRTKDDPEGKKTFFVKKVVHSRYGTEVINILSLPPISHNSSVDNVILANELSEIRCIGINIETRPDFITKLEVKRLRRLGVTKVELGVQSIYDDVLTKIRRGHKVSDVVLATALLKDAGFKVGYHMMPNLLGSSPKRDEQMIHELFVNPDFQPDYLKIYPCVVMPDTPLARIHAEGKYRSYCNAVLQDVLVDRTSRGSGMVPSRQTRARHSVE